MTVSDLEAAVRLSRKWRQEVRASGPFPCPVCSHVPQLREHRFTSTMCLALIYLYHRGGAGPVDPAKMPEQLCTGDSLRKLGYWGFVEHTADGFLVLTEEGSEALAGKEPVPLLCVVAHGEPMWFDRFVALRETLDSRFDFDELMAAEVTS